MKIIRKRWLDETGQMLALTAVSMTLFFAFLAMAIDVGRLFHAKRVAQTAADAAAVAAALEAEYGSSGSCATPLCAAQAAATSDGIANATTNVTLKTGSNITSPYHNSSGYIQAVVTNPSSTFFMNMFMPGKVAVAASAIAGTTPAPACIYVLDPSDADVIYTKHTITATNCGVQVNSSSPSATCDHGSGDLDAAFLHIVGGQDTGGGCKSNSSTPVTTGVASVGNPLAGLPDPSTKCTGGSNTFTGSTLSSPSQLPTPTANADGIASDAVYCFSATGGVTLKASSGTLNLGPGVYVFMHGVTLGSNVAVNGGTLDVAGGSFNQANTPLAITAPANTSAVYNGIAIIQTSTVATGGAKCDTSAPCLQLQFGSGSESLNGIVYAPTSEVVMQDMGGSVTAAGIIAYQLGYINTDLTITSGYGQANPTTTPLTIVSLVE